MLKGACFAMRGVDQGAVRFAQGVSEPSAVEVRLLFDVLKVKGGAVAGGACLVTQAGCCRRWSGCWSGCCLVAVLAWRSSQGAAP